MHLKKIQGLPPANSTSRSHVSETTLRESAQPPVLKGQELSAMESWAQLHQKMAAWISPKLSKALNL